MEDKLKLREGQQRLVFFCFFILVTIHIFTCMWVFFAGITPERNWLTLKQDSMVSAGETIGGNGQTYILSLYYIV